MKHNYMLHQLKDDLPMFLFFYACVCLSFHDLISCQKMLHLFKVSPMLTDQKVTHDERGSYLGIRIQLQSMSSQVWNVLNNDVRLIN